MQTNPAVEQSKIIRWSARVRVIRWVLRQRRDLIANIFRMKRPIDKWKEDFSPVKGLLHSLKMW